jgi:hypothetical protein
MKNANATAALARSTARALARADALTTIAATDATDAAAAAADAADAAA